MIDWNNANKAFIADQKIIETQCKPQCRECKYFKIVFSGYGHCENDQQREKYKLLLMQNENLIVTKNSGCNNYKSK